MIRRANHAAPPADLLVCFPSRSSSHHLTLIPKKLISSPARLMDHTFHHHHHHHHHHRTNHQLKKLPSTRQLSDSSWDKIRKATTGNNSDDASEPSSPKVTCAGQIKVRHNRSTGAATNCKSWQSVMEEIERIHKKSKNDKKKFGSWGDALGIKKDVMQFLTCLRNIKLDFRCFGTLPECDLSSDDEEDEEEEFDLSKKNTNQSELEDIVKTSQKNDVFSDWFMVVESEKLDEEPPSAAPVPPHNALLLMRCRSAPAKSWLENRAKLIVEQEEEDQSHTHQKQQQQDREEEDENVAEKGRKKLRDYLLVMEQYDTDFYKLSNDIAKETWVVGSINPFTRSRSWKR